jgi:hypothetical protein
VHSHSGSHARERGSVVATGERREFTVHVTVTAPAEFGDEVVAKFTQVMSIKDLNRKATA